jgi:hypothetical protein
MAITLAPALASKRLSITQMVSSSALSYALWSASVIAHVRTKLHPSARDVAARSQPAQAMSFKNPKRDNMGEWTPNMKRLRDMIDTNCPIMHGGAWPTLHLRGWRWEKNLYVPEVEQCIAVIDDYQDVHGPMNVTIGSPFNEEQMKPAPMRTLIGLYIRDVQDIMAELRRSLDDSDAVERWLSAN